MQNLFQSINKSLNAILSIKSQNRLQLTVNGIMKQLEDFESSSLKFFNQAAYEKSVSKAKVNATKQSLIGQKEMQRKIQKEELGSIPFYDITLRNRVNAIKQGETEEETLQKLTLASAQVFAERELFAGEMKEEKLDQKTSIVMPEAIKADFIDAANAKVNIDFFSRVRRSSIKNDSVMRNSNKIFKFMTTHYASLLRDDLSKNIKKSFYVIDEIMVHNVMNTVSSTNKLLTISGVRRSGTKKLEGVNQLVYVNLQKFLQICVKTVDDAERRERRN